MVLVHKLQNVRHACKEARAKPQCLECSCHHQRNDNTATLGVQYSGKLSREKTLANFAVLWLFAKVFSTKFGDVASFGAAEVSNLRKFSPQKSYFSPIRKSFLHEIWGCGVLWRSRSEQSAKVFSTKIVFFTNSRKFFLRKFSAIRYFRLRETVVKL